MTYELIDVPNRSAVRIHSGNFAGDTDRGLRSHVEGCILLGKSFGKLHGQSAILSSREAIFEFEQLLAGRPFILKVSENY